MWYICHVRDTAGHSGPGTRARGCKVRQYITHANKYTATTTPTLLKEGNETESSNPMAAIAKAEFDYSMQIESRCYEIYAVG
jgi:hypothetical protein